MVECFYTLDYTTSNLRQGKISPFAFHALVYTIADKYLVLGLRSIAFTKCRSFLLKSCQDVETMLESTYALNECMPQMDGKSLISELLIDAWVLGSSKLRADMGEGRFDAMLYQISWLRVALACRVLKGSQGGVFGWCAVCHNLMHFGSDDLKTGVKKLLWCDHCFEFVWMDPTGSVFKRCMYKLEYLFGRSGRRIRK
jgi:hypothetical protein